MVKRSLVLDLHKNVDQYFEEAIKYSDGELTWDNIVNDALTFYMVIVELYDDIHDFTDNVNTMVEAQINGLSVINVVTTPQLKEELYNAAKNIGDDCPEALSVSNIVHDAIIHYFQCLLEKSSYSPEEHPEFI